MGTIWFWLVAIMIAIYVLLDGFDLGAGAIHLLVAKTDEERRQVLASIGPVWDGNEVWLIAAGGTLYFAFPTLYASAFSGFYLPLMIVLWLLILRGASIEFRNHMKSAVWDPLWDFLFCASSLLLAFFFRAAVDRFPPRRRNRHSRLVHHSCRSIGPARAHDARWTVGTDEDQRRRQCARGKTGPPRVVGRRGAYGTGDCRHVPHPAASKRKFHDLAVGIPFPSACGGGDSRRPL